MRLIDALPLEKTIIEWQTIETIEPLTKTIIDNVGTLITHAPTIEAIPIEWIMRYSFDGKRKHPISITKMIEDWRKENQ